VEKGIQGEGWEVNWRGGRKWGIRESKGGEGYLQLYWAREESRARGEKKKKAPR